MNTFGLRITGAPLLCCCDDFLKVRRFIGFALLGVTQKWTRYTRTSMNLPPAH
ncbi:MAG: hypothetical protein ACREIF_08675 [Chthoniobacterales bacterium]